MTHDHELVRNHTLQQLNLQILTPQILDFHGVSAFNRGLLIDWILQVFTAFNKANNPSGFNTAVSLLDSYLLAKFRAQQAVGVDKLFLIGLGAVLLTAKYEEIKPIRS